MVQGLPLPATLPRAVDRSGTPSFAYVRGNFLISHSIWWLISAAILRLRGRALAFLTAAAARHRTSIPERGSRPGGNSGPAALPQFGISSQSDLSRSPLRAALRPWRGAVLTVAALSGALNILTLAGSLYMLEVYDRVLPSRSIPTLVGLTLLLLILYAFYALFDIIRSRLLLRVGVALDESLSAPVFEAVLATPLRAPAGLEDTQPVRDLDQVRNFLSGSGPGALFDLPWIPLYLGLCFVFHAWIGAAVLSGAIVLVLLTVLTEWLSRQPAAAASEAAGHRHAVAEITRRNAETVHALGMTAEMTKIWTAVTDQHRRHQQRATEVSSGLASGARVFRLLLQSIVLGLGAYLVIHQEATAGVILASSILTSRALAPIDLAIGNWKGFVRTRQGWARLTSLLGTRVAGPTPLSLPRPKESVAVEGASVTPPGLPRLTAKDVDFVLRTGQGLGIIGRSASGKSSVARMLVGAWRPLRGCVRLDGTALPHWRADELGRDIGYLPQDIELFSGTVAANIARFRSDATAESIMKAAGAAGVHDLVQRLPNGYQTQIGERGAGLSAGQRQRIALARALYGEPFLVVLDEPNSNLDAEGEQALSEAILGVRERGGVVVVIAHRPSALAVVDHVMVMAEGKVQAFGPKDSVLSRALKSVPNATSAPTQAPRNAHLGVAM
jgi:ATP-binding cassette subfamily C protein PrsD